MNRFHVQLSAWLHPDEYKTDILLDEMRTMKSKVKKKMEQKVVFEIICEGFSIGGIPQTICENEYMWWGGLAYQCWSQSMMINSAFYKYLCIELQK